MARRDSSGGDASGAPFHNPFGDLSRRLGIEPAPTPAPAPRAAAEARVPARAVVRIERKGRGGKTATVVEKLGLPPAELEGWLLDLKRTLGCGGAVEGDALLLQGDLRDRAAARLEARGVRKVTKG
ncbi:MAG: translation initiation factor [Deltaproteobacteria bacterium]|nr:translation initiation factor [Deltaproteobacteria bacterium]